MNSRGIPRDLLDKLDRAERDPNRKSQFRNNTYRRLIDLAHSLDASEKILATEKIHNYFIDFPERKDEAMNAIYDLCEDVDAHVRKAGYRAITLISRVDKDWLLRNVDVLIQLLQSDELDEVQVVERALIDHIDIDAVETLQVLSYQCVLDSKGLDDAELLLRRRLRKLVIKFLVVAAKEKVLLLVRDKQRGAEVEQALYKSLIPAIPNSDPEELHDLYSGILVNLPSISTPGPSTKGLQTALLNGASQCVKDEIRTNELALTIPKTIAYLQPAHNLTINRNAVEPLNLLRFYLSSGLLSPATLEKLAQDTKISVACFVAEAWSSFDGQMQKKGSSTNPQMVSSRNQLVEACPSLLEILFKTGLTNRRCCAACVSLLKACQSRQQSNSAWILPTHLSSVIQGIQALAEAISSTKDSAQTELVRNARILCRSLLSQEPQQQQQHMASGSSATPSRDNIQKGIVASKNRNNNTTIINRTRVASFANGNVGSPTKTEPNFPQARASTSISILGAHQLEDNSQNDNFQSRKRLKVGHQDDDTRSSSTPSLLSRLQIGPDGEGTQISSKLQQKRTYQNVDPKRNSNNVTAPRDIEDDTGSLRIKGAAHLDAQKALPTSLLNRIRIDGDIDAKGGGNKRKR